MIKAVIFDMDGVISDTQKLHVTADIMVMRSYGVVLGEKDIGEKFAGIVDQEMFGKLFHMHGIDARIEDAIKKKWEIMMDRSNDSIVPIQGTKELIYSLKKEDLKLAVASSSPVVFIDLVLSKLNLKEQFEVIASGEEVKNGKPNPEIFFLTAKKLGVKPQQCVVIEDSPNGMAAAKQAKMRCIGFVRRNRETSSDDYPADLVTDDLGALTPQKIKHL